MAMGVGRILATAAVAAVATAMAVAAPGSAAPSVLSTPRLSAHDAAMAYFPTHGLRRRRECRHYKTQAFRPDAPWHTKAGVYPSGLSALLDCGARVLDLRLSVCADDDGRVEVCLHHGAAKVEHTTLDRELPSVVRWSHENAQPVLLKMVPDNRVDGQPDPELLANVRAALEAVGVPSIDNRDAQGRPMDGCWHGEAPWREEDLHGVVAVWKYDIGGTGQPAQEVSCVQDNFVPAIGYNPHNPDKSFGNLLRYAQAVAAHAFDPWGRDSPEAVFEELQLIWQTAGTEVHYELSYYLLEINEATRLNEWVLNLTQAQPELFRRANMVKLNNLCLHGPAIARAIGTNVTDAQLARCQAHCKGFADVRCTFSGGARATSFRS